MVTLGFKRQGKPVFCHSAFSDHRKIGKRINIMNEIKSSDGRLRLPPLELPSGTKKKTKAMRTDRPGYHDSSPRATSELERPRQTKPPQVRQVCCNCCSVQLRPVTLPKNSRWAIIDEKGYVTPLPPGCIPVTPHHKYSSVTSDQPHGSSSRGERARVSSSSSPETSKRPNKGELRKSKSAPEHTSVQNLQQSFFKSSFDKIRSHFHRERRLPGDEQPQSYTNKDRNNSVEETRKTSLYSVEEFLRYCEENDTDE